VTQSSVRLIGFLLGLGGFGLREHLAPHHAAMTRVWPRWCTNLGLGFVSGIIVSLACSTCFLLATSGTLSSVSITFFPFPFPLRIAAEVALLDLLVYWLHRAYYLVPALWRFHLVHHMDLDLDVSSASRFHPGEVTLSALAKLLVVLLLGISPMGLVIFEVIMLLCAQFQHANIAVSPHLERWLWYTLVPPEMHRLHHTPAVSDTDSNYGTIFTCWDRLFGTLNARHRAPSESFGVTT
jgi:sterol desaturase/sphingolipid hydroxylase (fatty acid hydroxylase superfamily)